MDKIKHNTKLLSKLFIFSILYGLLNINYIDLVVVGSPPGYHLWLTIAYFAPFIPLLLLLGFDEWELVGSLGLTASLMNDLFYYPIGILLFQKSINLSEWYMFQLGFKGFATRWTFNAAVFMFPVTSLLMGATIYLRTAIIAGLIYKGWSSKLSSVYQVTTSFPNPKVKIQQQNDVKNIVPPLETRGTLPFKKIVCDEK